MKNREENFKKQTNDDDFCFEFAETSLSDYYNFNLRELSQKIKIQSYRPKPKMLYL